MTAPAYSTDLADIALAESGDIVKLVKGLSKLAGVKRLGETGVQSVLDGLSGKGETDDDTEE